MKKKLAKEEREAAKRHEELNESNLVIDVVNGPIDKFIVHENKVYRVYTEEDGTMLIKGFGDSTINDEKLWVTLLGRIQNG